MTKPFPRISLVIPAYNEEAQLANCLRAISRLNIKPYEVIVVDNNSTDDTALVASQFPFVTLINESRQGVINARSCGFNAARGDIIGRIDADTILPADWLDRLQQIFADPRVAAVSGQPHYYDFPLSEVADVIDRTCRRFLARNMANSLYLYGANMALRRQAWQAVRGQLCLKAHMHEDFDLAIHLQELGLKVIYDESLVASVCSRRIDVGFTSYLRYNLVSPRTYKMHRLASRKYMYPVVLVCLLCYIPGRILYRSFDPVNSRYSLKQLLVSTSARVDPTVNVAS